MAALDRGEPLTVSATWAVAPLWHREANALGSYIVMDLAWISVTALAITVLVSCTTRLNPGVLAIAFSWIIASGIAPLVGDAIPIKTVVSGFPAQLFLTLCGITLLFSQAQVNGTLDRVAHVAVRCCRGNAGMIPIAFFGLAAVMSAIGAGSIAAAALVAPMAMAAATNARIPAFLMAIMVGHGAIAGGMSPFALTGIIVNGLMSRLDLPGHEWLVFFHILAANSIVALMGYLVFGGWRLLRKSPHAKAPALPESVSGRVSVPDGTPADQPLTRSHYITLAAITVLVTAVIGWQIPVGMAAFAAAAFLTVVRAADEREAFRVVPWPVILMVCGVTVLTSLIERTGGIERLTDVIAAVATSRTLPGMLAFVTGAISVYSSTSGVVLPTFLPTIPSLVAKLGGDPLALASSINIGGNLVDVSPLSTIGALCIACAGASEDRRILFHKLLIWGLSMSLVAAVVCTLFFG